MRDFERYKVSVPAGERDGIVIDHFTIEEGDVHNIRLALHNRPINPPGTYTRMSEGATVWMSDVPAEVLDHKPFFGALEWCQPEPGTGRILINGLGLGMCLQAALRSRMCGHVDVVERDMRVINLVAPHYYRMARECGKTLTTHHADALTVTFPTGTKWDIVWHDIWPDISVDNLPEMATLKRKYAQRCIWQGCWSEQMCRDARSGKLRRAHQETVERFYESVGLTKGIRQEMIDYLAKKMVSP